MKAIERLLLIGFLLILASAFNWSCKSVEKSQTKKSESVAVSKSDSSKSVSYTSIDTTKTDNSTEITETTISIDSIDFSHASTVPGSIIEILPIHKAKGVKIQTKTTKQAAVVQAGQTSHIRFIENAIKSDSTASKDESKKEVSKDPDGSTWLWLWLIPAGLAVVWWKRYWIIEKFFA